MPGKVFWLVCWLTAVFWLGGFWGCASTGDDQNYEMLNNDEPAFDADQPGLQSRQDIAEELGLASHRTPSSTPAAATTIITDAPNGADVTMTDNVPSEDGPSINGLDRSNWKRMRVTYTDGRTWHNPYYFKDANFHAESSRASAPATGVVYDEAAFLKPLEGAKSGNPPDMLGLFLQPGKFGLDLVTLPGKMIFALPFSYPSTPPSNQ